MKHKRLLHLYVFNIVPISGFSSEFFNSSDAWVAYFLEF